MFTAYDEFIFNCACPVPSNKPISLLPASFFLPCMQQLWPILCQTVISLQHRSGVNEADLQQAQRNGRQSLSHLSVILDSGANLNIFCDIELLEHVWSIPARSKSIQGAAGLFECEEVGDGGAYIKLGQSTIIKRGLLLLPGEHGKYIVTSTLVKM